MKQGQGGNIRREDAAVADKNFFIATKQTNKQTRTHGVIFMRQYKKLLRREAELFTNKFYYKMTQRVCVCLFKTNKHKHRLMMQGGSRRRRMHLLQPRTFLPLNWPPDSNDEVRNPKYQSVSAESKSNMSIKLLP